MFINFSIDLEIDVDYKHGAPANKRGNPDNWDPPVDSEINITKAYMIINSGKHNESKIELPRDVMLEIEKDSGFISAVQEDG